MLTTQDLIRLYTIENDLIHRQAEGLTQVETLLQPQPTGNCMNWVLGHLLENQVTVLELLGAQAPFPGSELERYRRTSDPVTGEGRGVWQVERLLEELTQVHEKLVARLAEMQEEDFAREIHQGERTFTVAWRLAFLQFHYTYHVGQLELLRQMAGKADKLV
jgi:hypothetical protein